MTTSGANEIMAQGAKYKRILFDWTINQLKTTLHLFDYLSLKVILFLASKYIHIDMNILMLFITSISRIYYFAL